MSHIRLLTKDEMIASGTLYNYELIMEDYLNAMPFNEKERKEVKMSLLIKINSAFDRVISGRDKKALKKLNKRFMELKKIAENHKKKHQIFDEEEEQKYLNDLADLMFKRT